MIYTRLIKILTGILLVTGSYYLVQRYPYVSSSRAPQAPQRATLETIAASDTVHIVFDLGNTLVKPKQMSLAWQMLTHDGVGLGTLIHYKDRIRSSWYQTLHTIDTARASQHRGPHHVCDDQGYALPHIMIDWLDGTLTWTLEDILAGIDRLYQAGFYESKQHARLMKSMARTTFQRASASFELIRPMFQILKKLAQNKRVRLYILSNWNDTAFQDFITCTAGRMLCSYIHPEDMVISGRIHINKPDPRAFEYLIDKYQIPVHSCIFIDDQAENVQAAQQIGLMSLDATNPKNIKKTLQSLQLL